jgi:phosphinothricin acetyltransferase
MVAIRHAVAGDLPALTGIYNHYIVHTAITFDVKTYEPHERQAWFDDHHPDGRHRLLVGVDADGAVLGYASSSRWRPKAAYDTTVESSVYCRDDVRGRGVGSTLYAALFTALAGQDVHRIVAGVALPNPASIAIHERFGFVPVGVFHQVGLKFGQFWDVAWFERAL